jgi:alpha-galactosidase
MEKYCPDAILLNYTNPMGMLCRAMQRESFVIVTGLCHSVQLTAKMLANWIGVKETEITYVCAGINHLAWYIEFKCNGVDAYPLIREAVMNTKIYNQEIVRNEILLNLGYYVTESSGHNSEYNWWFRKRPDLIEKYCLPGTGWNPGKYGFTLDEYLQQEKTWKDEIKRWLANPEPLDLNRGNEYAAHIINAYMGGEPFKFNGNVANTGIIKNLPEDACIEVPVYIDKKGLQPIHIGSLPPQCALLDHVNISVEEMAVEGCLRGDPQMIFQSIAYDPLTASVLSLKEIKAMVSEMFKINEKHLPTFRSLSV